MSEQNSELSPRGPSTEADKATQSTVKESLIEEILRRLNALENRPAMAIDREAIDAALSEHPDIATFRAFTDKWQNL